MNTKEEVNTIEKDVYDSNREYFDKTPLFNENGDLVYDWLADLGMTSHITHQWEAFATYEPIERTPIKGVSSVKAYAVGMGTVFLNSECDRKVHTIELRDVLHIPTTGITCFQQGIGNNADDTFLDITQSSHFSQIKMSPLLEA